MGVGDRHSKRKPPSPGERSYVVDDRELDDPFSAWDDDDAGAQKAAPPPPIQRALATPSSTAQTRIERRPVVSPPSPKGPLAPPAVVAEGSARRATPLGDALLDPLAMRDIVISRARTLDDPLTTGVLAEIARGDRANDRGQRTPLPYARVETVRLARIRSEERMAARSADVSPTPPLRAASPDTRDELATPRRRTTRRAIARDEPFRKK